MMGSFPFLVVVTSTVGVEVVIFGVREGNVVVAGFGCGCDRAPCRDEVAGLASGGATAG